MIATTMVAGSFIAVMDNSVVNVSLPHMMGSFGQDLSAITWVATSYSIAEIVLVTMTGWWSTLIGRKRLYLISLAVFAVGSILCGTAQTFTQMLVYRIIQGIGGGALIPVSQAILSETFPAEEQGMAMAMYGMGVVLAPAFGPIIGGWLTDLYGWPWIFYINIPICAVGMFMVLVFVHDPPYLRRGVTKIDWSGIALLATALVTLQLVLERGQDLNWFESRLIIAGAIVCVVSAAALILVELRVSDPVVNVSLLRNIPLSVTSTIGILFGVILFGTTFVLPQFTQLLLGYSAYDAGITLLPRAVTLFIFMPIAGLLYGRIDARLLLLLGATLVIWSLYDMAHLSLGVSFWNLVPMLLIMGIGMPFMFVIATSMSLSSIAAHQTTDAASIYTLARRVGGNVGYALVATLVTRGQQSHRASLVGNISQLSPNFLAYKQNIATHLTQAGMNPTEIEQASYALTNAVVDRQATMLAFNDVAWVVGALFLITIPLIFLLPGRTAHSRPSSD